MNKSRVFFLILMLLPLAVTCVSLPILPDQIPAHYGLDGMVTRYGSKYETLILPIAAVPLGVFMLSMGKLAGKMAADSDSRSRKVVEKAVLLAGILSLGILNVLTYYFLYAAFHSAAHLGAIPLSLERIVFSLLGIVLVVIGKVMPKYPRNGIIGLRTIWSLSSDEAWRRSQKFGGTVLVISGGALFLGNALIFEGLAVYAYTTATILFMLALCIVYTYRAGRA